MEKAIQSLDLDTKLGMVTLSDGQKVAIPKLSTLKLIKLVKFIAIDGARLYGQIKKIVEDPEIDEMEKMVTVLETLTEEQLMKVFSILLDIPVEDVLSLDLNEMLEILLVYTDKVDFNKTFLLCRELAKKLFKKELPPTIGEWIQEVFSSLRTQNQEPEIRTVSAGLNSSAI